MSVTVDAEFAPKLECLFQPKRYKVLYGGRGAGRSWGAARALLLIGAQREIRVLCAREFQNSIAESVHKLLKDQIEALGLGGHYDVQAAKILGVNGTTFSFEGIKNNTTRIKSYEGIDYCWVEEANKTSKSSWEILIPTIRKPGSEIWLTFNPELETDYTFVQFVQNAGGDAFVVKMTWADNPWFPDVLMAEKEKMRVSDPDAYDNVWEGNCRQILEEVVFAKELRRAYSDSRVCRVPWEPTVPVDTFWDLGHADQTAIWFVQVVAMQRRVLEYYENQGEELTHYLRVLQRKEYVYGTAYLPHDARHKRIGQRHTIELQVRGLGFKTHIVPKINKKVNAISAARAVFPGCWFDAESCKAGLARLKGYRYRVAEGQYSDEPLHDANSNGADAFMTMAQAIRPHKGDTSGLLKKLTERVNPFAESAPMQSWMG